MSFWVDLNLCKFFLLFVYICIAIWDPIIKGARVGIPLTDLTSLHFYACPKPGLAFQHTMLWSFFVCSMIWGERWLFCWYWWNCWPSLFIMYLTGKQKRLQVTTIMKGYHDLSLGFVTRLARQVPLVEQELLNLQERLSSPLIFSGIRVTRSFVFCVVFCISLFVLLYFLFWPLCCLFFFDLRTLITPLVSSNSSCKILRRKCKSPIIQARLKKWKTKFNIKAVFIWI